jgi:4-hydroxy-tetrahydrodipicolinate synthase
MLPPFYYKGVPDEGLFRIFSEVIERVGDVRLRVYLYHIPPVSQVPISIRLIERLLNRYKGSVAGIKDSSGDWSNTQALLDVFRGADFDVFAGSEAFLLANLRGGGVGCISATANVNPGAIHRVFEQWKTPRADELQAQISAIRTTIHKYPMMIGALKAIVAHYGDDPDWATVRPPLVELGADKTRSLVAELDALGFVMPGLAPATARV